MLLKNIYIFINTFKKRIYKFKKKKFSDFLEDND